MIAPEGLWGMEQDSFLTNSSEVIVAETCILALTVISYILPKRADLVPYFEATFSANAEKMIQRIEVPAEKQDDPAEVAKAVLLRARLSLLLGYYADMLFVKDSDIFQKVMEFLFNSVGYDKPFEKVISLQSIDTLNTIVSDSDLAPRLVNFLPTIVGITNQWIPVIKVKEFFDYVHEFVKFYACVLDDQILSILQACINRIVTEQSKIMEKGDTEISGIVISQLINIIKSIS